MRETTIDVSYDTLLETSLPSEQDLAPPEALFPHGKGLGEDDTPCLPRSLLQEIIFAHSPYRGFYFSPENVFVFFPESTFQGGEAFLHHFSVQ